MRSNWFAEFPALAEMMALSVTAGESALAALERICLTSRGSWLVSFLRFWRRPAPAFRCWSALQEFAGVLAFRR